MRLVSQKFAQGFAVIPANPGSQSGIARAGIQETAARLDYRFRGNDWERDSTFGNRRKRTHLTRRDDFDQHRLGVCAPAPGKHDTAEPTRDDQQ